MKRLLIGVLLATSLAIAAEDATVARLANVPFFAFGGVGFAGSTSKGELDYKQILARPTAQADFEKVFEMGNQAAKAYALTALYRLNHDEFMRLAQPLRSSEQKVHTMVGCIMGKRTMAQLISEIESKK